MDLSAGKSCILCYKRTLSTGSLIIGGQIIPNSNKVRDFGLNKSCSANLSEHALAQAAKANKIVRLLHRTFKLNQSKLSLLKTHVKPILEYFSLIASVRVRQTSNGKLSSHIYGAASRHSAEHNLQGTICNLECLPSIASARESKLNTLQ